MIRSREVLQAKRRRGRDQRKSELCVYGQQANLVFKLSLLLLNSSDYRALTFAPFPSNDILSGYCFVVLSQVASISLSWFYLRFIVYLSLNWKRWRKLKRQQTVCDVIIAVFVVLIKWFLVYFLPSSLTYSINMADTSLSIESLGLVATHQCGWDNFRTFSGREISIHVRPFLCENLSDVWPQVSTAWEKNYFIAFPGKSSINS